MEPVSQANRVQKVVFNALLIVFGLTAFDFGGIQGTEILEIIAAALAFLEWAYFNSEPEGKERRRTWIWLTPFLLFAALVSISNFWVNFSSGSIYVSLLSLFGIFGFLTLGIRLRAEKDLPLAPFLGAILGGMALLVFVSLIDTLVVYGPFYVSRYAGQNYFYDGSAFPIAAETSWLSGFAFVAVKREYAGIYAFILASLLPGLLFLDPRKDRVRFSLLALLSGLGLAYFILLGSVTPLEMLVPIYGLGLLLRYLKTPQKAPLWERVAGGILVGGAASLVIFMVGVAAAGINIYGSSPLLTRIFNNGRLTQAINETINATLKSGKAFQPLDALFGMSPYRNGFLASSYWGETVVRWPSIPLRTYEFNALMEGGLIAFFSLCVFLVLLLPVLRRFVHEGAKIDPIRVVIVFFLLGYGLYASLQGSSFPLVNDPYAYLSPFRTNSLFLLVVFFIGYVFKPLTPAKPFQRKGADDE